MATSSMAISSGSIVTHANATANAAADVNTNVTAIVNAFNTMLETASGHHHDNVNSRFVFGGIGSLTIVETVIALRMGTFG